VVVCLYSSVPNAATANGCEHKERAPRRQRPPGQLPTQSKASIQLCRGMRNYCSSPGAYLRYQKSVDGASVIRGRRVGDLTFAGDARRCGRYYNPCLSFLSLSVSTVGRDHSRRPHQLDFTATACSIRASLSPENGDHKLGYLVAGRRR
jgi:hypothetical protein